MNRSTSRNTNATLVPRRVLLDRLLKVVHKQCTVCQPGQRVMERSLPQIVLRAMALDGRGEHGRETGHEADVIVVEMAFRRGVRAQRAVRQVALADEDGDAGNDACRLEQRVLREARVRREIVDDDRAAGGDRVPRLGVRGVGRRVGTDHLLRPTFGGAQDKRTSPRQELEHRGVVHLQGLGDDVDGLGHHRFHAKVGEGVASELGHRGLLRRRVSRRLLVETAFGDVPPDPLERHHATVHFEGADGKTQPYDGSVLAGDRHIKRAGPFLPSAQELEPRKQPAEQGGIVVELLRAVAEQPLGRGADVLDPQCGIDADFEDEIVRVVSKDPELG
ncbi:MAG TPA: hypothetical protein VKV34_11830, partial [Thermoleophilia bacterium]|nr:hypothetical protein [Thermoleophilia bacterium]